MKTATERAMEYVKETDYISDVNRNIAGNAFVAGFKAAIAMLRDHKIEHTYICKEDPTKNGKMTHYGSAFAEWLETKIE